MSPIKLTGLCLISICFLNSGYGQSGTYKDSITSYIKKYVQEHEVVTGKDKPYLQFFPVDEKFRITCRFERKLNSPWFQMQTSGLLRKIYRVFGTVYFTITDTAVTLNIYQSQDLMQTEKYKDHLFIPFTDVTSGEETYSSGRYYELDINDIKNNQLVIDFNKAYNPYCAYVSDKYNCPIPPKENFLPVAIRAGEKVFTKPH